MPTRPVISYFLIGVLLLNTVGFLAVYSTLKRIHRDQVDVQLALPAKKKVYERLHVARKEFDQFVWRRPQKEFEHNNALYDIVIADFVGDSVFIVCYKDHKEMKMDALLAKVVCQQGDTSHSQQSWSHLFHPFIFEPSYLLAHHLTEFRKEKKDYFHYTVQLSNPELTIHLPPPQRNYTG